MRSDTSRVLTAVVALAALLCAATPAAALKVTIEAPANDTVFKVGETGTFRARIGGFGDKSYGWAWYFSDDPAHGEAGTGGGEMKEGDFIIVEVQRTLNTPCANAFASCIVWEVGSAAWAAADITFHVIAIELTSSTLRPAGDGTPDTRRKIGIIEEVQCTAVVQPALPAGKTVQWTRAGGGAFNQDTGNAVTYTAAPEADTAEVNAHVDRVSAEPLTFTVVTPAGTTHSQTTPPSLVPIGQPGPPDENMGGYEWLVVYHHPRDVNFERLEGREDRQTPIEFTWPDESPYSAAVARFIGGGQDEDGVRWHLLPSGNFDFVGIGPPPPTPISALDGGQGDVFETPPWGINMQYSTTGDDPWNTYSQESRYFQFRLTGRRGESRPGVVNLGTTWGEWQGPWQE